jgi:hypothetical protein
MEAIVFYNEFGKLLMDLNRDILKEREEIYRYICENNHLTVDEIHEHILYSLTNIEYLYAVVAQSFHKMKTIYNNIKMVNKEKNDLRFIKSSIEQYYNDFYKICSLPCYKDQEIYNCIIENNKKLERVLIPLYIMELNNIKKPEK